MPPLNWRKVALTEEAAAAAAIQPITSFFTRLPKPPPANPGGRPQKNKTNRGRPLGATGAGRSAPPEEEEQDDDDDDDEDKGEADEEDEDDETQAQAQGQALAQAPEVGRTTQAQKRVNWNLPESKDRLQKALRDWDEKTGEHLTSEPGLSIRKYATLVNIPLATFSSYACADVTKRKQVGIQVGARELISEASGSFAIDAIRRSSVLCAWFPKLRPCASVCVPSRVVPRMYVYYSYTIISSLTDMVSPAVS